MCFFEVVQASSKNSSQKSVKGKKKKKKRVAQKPEGMQIQMPHELVSFGENSHREGAVTTNTVYFEKTITGELK